MLEFELFGDEHPDVVPQLADTRVELPGDMVMFCSVHRCSVFMFGGVVCTGYPLRIVGGWSYASSHASTVNVGEVPWRAPRTLARVLRFRSSWNGAAASLFGSAPEPVPQVQLERDPERERRPRSPA